MTPGVAETQFGDWSFEFRKVTESEVEARIEFAKLRAERIDRNGWKVFSEDFYKCLAENPDGRGKHPPTMFKLILHCRKPEPTPPEKYRRKEKSLSDRDFKLDSAADEKG